MKTSFWAFRNLFGGHVEDRRPKEAEIPSKTSCHGVLDDEGVMLRTKRDVDRHVEQLEAKIHSESERALKALTVSKLYYNVGEYESAKR